MQFLAQNLPKHKCIFLLDQVDLVKVRELIGDHSCLMGGLAPGFIVNSSPQKLEDKLKEYIEKVGPDGRSDVFYIGEESPSSAG